MESRCSATHFRCMRESLPDTYHPVNVAVLDDYQGVALSIADWSKVNDRANITVFQDHLAASASASVGLFT